MNTIRQYLVFTTIRVLFYAYVLYYHLTGQTTVQAELDARQV